MDQPSNARPPSYRIPAEAIAGARPYPLWRTALSIAAATLVALALGSKALVTWVNAQPIGDVSDFLLYVAQMWDEWMDQAGLTHFAEAIREFLRNLQKLR